MQTTDPFGGWTPPAPPPPPSGDRLPPHRVLRRSRTDRVGAGVSGGLGRYFGIDPVLFRVLFATAAFFGGVGVIAYLLAWVAIPEEGTAHAPIDRWIGELRRRKIPFWAVIVVGVIVVWAIGFSWWAPRPFIPVVIVAIVLAAVLSRRGPAAGSASTRSPSGPEAFGTGTVGAPTVPVDLTKPGPGVVESVTDVPADPADPATEPMAGFGADPSAWSVGAPGTPNWAAQTQLWLAESRAAGRLRRRRARPVWLATVLTLIVTLGILIASDALGGIVLAVYFWVLLGIPFIGLVVGLALRRTPWSLTPLVIWGIVGIIGFGNSPASMHDGFGQREWAPTTQLAGSYRLGFGQAVLDLRQLAPSAQPRTTEVVLGAGQAKILLPPTLNATVRAEIHIGAIEVDGTAVEHHGNSGGYDLTQVVQPPSTAGGAPVTIVVRLADGQITVQHGG